MYEFTIKILLLFNVSINLCCFIWYFITQRHFVKHSWINQCVPIVTFKLNHISCMKINAFIMLMKWINRKWNLEYKLNEFLNEPNKYLTVLFLAVFRRLSICLFYKFPSYYFESKRKIIIIGVRMSNCLSVSLKK